MWWYKQLQLRPARNWRTHICSRFSSIFIVHDLGWRGADVKSDLWHLSDEMLIAVDFPSWGGLRCNFSCWWVQMGRKLMHLGNLHQPAFTLYVYMYPGQTGGNVSLLILVIIEYINMVATLSDYCHIIFGINTSSMRMICTWTNNELMIIDHINVYMGPLSLLEYVFVYISKYHDFVIFLWIIMIWQWISSHAHE